ncbi:hypothetical protein C9426_00845 [Serratia sp. S1B]|nr:hypothetical protein C9426_00845 [Serratia sp. S1B]
MLQKIKDKIIDLGYVFEEFPKVYWAFILTIALTGITAIGYQQLLIKIYQIEILNSHPFQKIVEENLNSLMWGNLILPIVVLLITTLSTIELYEKLHFKKYGFLP